MTFYVGESVKALLAIKLKSREDQFSDQVSRILVTKTLVLISTAITVIWFHSETRCIPPVETHHKIPPQFLHRGCWAKGFYIYPYLADHMRQSVYYGIPPELKMTGIRTDKPDTLCDASDRSEVSDCVPMKREYFTQYQCFPMYILMLSFFFYLPYMFYRWANMDMIELRSSLRTLQIETDEVFKTYFSRDAKRMSEDRFRVMCNYAVKCLYVISNVMAMSFLHKFLNNRFYSYGLEWMSWYQGSTSERFFYETREEPIPGNRLLPVFGMCDLYDVRHDLTTRYANKVTVVCEISAHAIYQHVLIMIWFILVFSNVVSILGLIYYLFNHLRMLQKTKVKKGTLLLQHGRRELTLRQIEYLECIKSIDLAIHSKITKMLEEKTTSNHRKNQHQNGDAKTYPLKVL